MPVPRRRRGYCRAGPRLIGCRSTSPTRAPACGSAMRAMSRPISTHRPTSPASSRDAAVSRYSRRTRSTISISARSTLRSRGSRPAWSTSPTPTSRATPALPTRSPWHRWRSWRRATRSLSPRSGGMTCRRRATSTCWSITGPMPGCRSTPSRCRRSPMRCWRSATCPPVRAAWRGWFDHYVFGDAASEAGAHLPPHARGPLGPLSPQAAEAIRGYIASMLR